VAQYINFLEDFNYQLKHILGAHNRANVLFRRPDHDNSLGDNDQVVALPDEVFARTISMVTLDKAIRLRQQVNQLLIEEWASKYHLSVKDNGVWYKGTALVVTGDKNDYRALLEIYHDTLTAGHLGIAKML
jgi:hypothetical protein